MIKYLFNTLSHTILHCIIFSCFISSCTPNHKGRERLLERATNQNTFFSKHYVQGGKFTLTTYQKMTDIHAPVVIYLEGDGYAFKRYEVSDDPTPLKPLVVKLALQDARPNVVYMARPCQYTTKELNPLCNHMHWTDHRMSEELVADINEAINKIAGTRKVDLIGFSGGGGIAVLVAARNSHVRSIITLAGNLDYVAFNKFHNDRPMIGSLNPKDYSHMVKNIPQLHLSGENDKIVPPFIANDFVASISDANGKPRCAQQRILPGVSHVEGWQHAWKWVLSLPLVCAP